MLAVVSLMDGDQLGELLRTIIQGEDLPAGNSDHATVLIQSFPRRRSGPAFLLKRRHEIRHDVVTGLFRIPSLRKGSQPLPALNLAFLGFTASFSSTRSAHHLKRLV